MSRSIAPTQFVTSGNFVSPTALAAVDRPDCFVLGDLEIHAIWPEIHRDRISGSDDAHRPQKQPPFQHGGVLADQIGKVGGPAGVFKLRRKGWFCHGATGQSDEKKKTFHESIVAAFAANASCASHRG